MCKPLLRVLTTIVIALFPKRAEHVITKSFTKILNALLLERTTHNETSLLFKSQKFIEFYSITHFESCSDGKWSKKLIWVGHQFGFKY